MTPKIYSYIRFSTKEQLNGSSKERQETAIKKYKNNYGIELDTNFNLRDFGYSAFHAKHIKQGALGKFLELIKRGDIAKGSILLIENIDRLSRQVPTDAYDLFYEIIKKGIMVVTLHNGFEYTIDTLNTDPGKLYTLIGEIIRAHEESQRKSDLIGNAWSIKREKIYTTNKKLTGKCPAWLKLNKAKNKFEPIPERVEAIKKIFELRLAGYPKLKIIHELNDNPNIWKPEKNKRNKFGGWQTSYIQKIINNKAVIGEFQPYKIENGKRVKVGNPIPNYYEPVVDEQTFKKVQSIIKSNREARGNGGGKTGKYRNLFKNYIECGICGHPMHFIDKGKSPKGGQYLHCSGSYLHRSSCRAKPIRYDEFEKIFFDSFEEFDITQIIPSPEKLEKRKGEIIDQLISNNHDISDYSQQRKNLLKASSKTSDPESHKEYEDARNKLKIKIKKLETDNKRLNAEKAELENEAKSLSRDIEKAKEVYELIENAKNEEQQIKIRLRLREEIRKFVRLIKVYPIQDINVELEQAQQKYEEYRSSLKNSRVTVGQKVKLNMLGQKIDRIIKEKEGEIPYVTIDSKYIDRIVIKYTGISEWQSQIVRMKNRQDEM